MNWLKHAFAVDPPGPARPDSNEAELIERLAGAVVRRGMSSAALLFLECSHPFNFVASQVMVFFGPVAELIFSKDEYRRLAAFLERRGSIEFVCQRIEHLEAARRSAGSSSAAAVSGEADPGRVAP